VKDNPRECPDVPSLGCLWYYSRTCGVTLSALNMVLPDLRTCPENKNAVTQYIVGIPPCMTSGMPSRFMSTPVMVIIGPAGMAGMAAVIG